LEKPKIVRGGTAGYSKELQGIRRQPFNAAKARIRQMEFRFVEETDQNSQSLLEIYCTLALNAKYNDFDTH
jgi:hypothetical protein